MNRTLIVILAGIIMPLTARAQQMPLYSQYVMNTYMINPAITGSDGYTTFNLTARQQWLGIRNAPATRSVSGATRLLKKSYIIKRRNVLSKGSLRPSSKGRVGLGGYIYNDRNGAVERTGLQASYAYHIFVQETQFSMGLSAGVFQFRIHEDELYYGRESGIGTERDDPLKGSLNKTIYVPDANLGFYVTDPRFYAGISVTQLFQSYIKLGNRALDEYKMIRHYYLLGGYHMRLPKDFSFEPSILIKGTEKLAIQADISGRIKYLEDYWVGLTIRTSGTLIAMVGARYKQAYIGYAFDYSFSAIQRHTYGSHELVLALKLGDNARRYRWLQRY